MVGEFMLGFLSAIGLAPIVYVIIRGLDWLWEAFRPNNER